MKQIMIALKVVALLIFLSLSSFAMTSDNYRIDTGVFVSGGGTSSSSGYSVTGVLGQSFSGDGDSTNYAHNAGFWNKDTVDSVPPDTSGIPSGDSWSSTSDVTLTGTVTDADSGVASVTINGNAVRVSGDGSFALPVTLHPGVNTFILVVTDVVGNQTTRVITYNLDTVVPNVEVSTLPDGSHTSDSTLNVAGILSDHDGIQTLLVGSDPVTINPDGSFSASVTLVPGDNLVQITAIDSEGNQTMISRTIILDPTAPTVDITGPADNLQTARNAVDIAGTAAAGTLVTITDNDGNISTPDCTDGDFSAPVILDYGLNTIIITITDPVTGATQATKRTVFYDFLKPGLAVTNPAKDIAITNGLISLTGIVTDALTEVTVTITADGVEYHPVVDVDGNFTQDNITFSKEGVYPVIVTVTDLNGNSSSVQRNIRYQRGYIVINKGASTTASTAVTLDLSYVPAEPATSVSTMQLLYNNTAWTAPMTFVNKKSITIPSGDGVKTVWVRFTDNTGAVSAFYSDTIILDTKVPVGAITINNGAETTLSPIVTLNLAVTDANGVVKMQFSDNGTTWSPLEPFSVKRAYTLPGIPGLKKVYVRFVDGAGKVSAAVSDTISYAATTTSATAAGVTISSGATYTTTTTVPVAITSPGAEYTQMRVSVNGTTWASWETTKTSKSVTLPAGDGVKTVYVQFRAGSTGTPTAYSDSIILDTIAPKGTVQINGGAYSTNNRTVTLTLTASDLNGVKDMQFSLTNLDWATAPWETFSGTKMVTLPSGDGVKTVWVKFRDNAGKISAAISDTILVDSVAPTGKVLINAGATVITSRTVTLSFSSTGATFMRLSLDGGTTVGDWEPFVTSKKVTLPAGDGIKTVMVKFRDLTGNESGIASASASYAQAQVPAGITVPASDADGNYTVTWLASPTTGVTYELQEATNASFTTGLRTAYSGTALSVNITLRTKGINYYYRVRAKKTGYEPSSWTTGANGCHVSP